MLSKVNIAAGIDKETTNYGAEGRWIDAVNVRFRSGLPEKVGGWSKLTDTTILWCCKSSENLVFNARRKVLSYWYTQEIVYLL